MNSKQAIGYFKNWINDLSQFEDEKEAIKYLELAITALERQKKIETLRTLDEWHEDYGDVLWWELPVSESPYCGTPLDSNWPGYYTHWSELPANEIVGKWNDEYFNGKSTPE